MYILKIPDGMGVNGKYFQTKKLIAGQLKAFVGVNEIEPGEDHFMNSYMDLSEDLRKKLEVAMAFTQDELDEIKHLPSGIRTSITWQINISSELDRAGFDDGEDSDTDANLAKNMKARLSLKKKISNKLSPKKPSA